MSEWGLVLDDQANTRALYRKGLKIEWSDPEAVKAYRRAWWRERRDKVAKTRRELRLKWAEFHGLPSDRVRAIRECARQEAARRGVDPLVVYKEWQCLTPAEHRKLNGG